jgi:hypothetical protein
MTSIEDNSDAISVRNAVPDARLPEGRAGRRNLSNGYFI